MKPVMHKVWGPRRSRVHLPTGGDLVQDIQVGYEVARRISRRVNPVEAWLCWRIWITLAAETDA